MCRVLDIGRDTDGVTSRAVSGKDSGVICAHDEAVACCGGQAQTLRGFHVSVVSVKRMETRVHGQT